jgi:plastocyanin
MTAKKKQFKVGDHVTWTWSDNKTSDSGQITKINGDCYAVIKRANGTQTAELLIKLRLL